MSTLRTAHCRHASPQKQHIRGSIRTQDQRTPQPGANTIRLPYQNAMMQNAPKTIHTKYNTQFNIVHTSTDA